jgi:hypothetical protein
MVAVPEVQPPIVEVISMIAVRYDLVAAAIVTASALGRSAGSRVGRADFDDALVVMTVVRRVQVTVVKIVGMFAVLNRQMTTVRAVGVRMAGMSCVTHIYSSGLLKNVCSSA